MYDLICFFLPDLYMNSTIVIEDACLNHDMCTSKIIVLYPAPTTALYAESDLSGSSFKAIHHYTLGAWHISSFEFLLVSTFTS